VSGAGRVALTDEMDGELTLRFNQTSLDPYLRFFEPRLSPFTNAVAGGTVRVTGELSNVEHLLVEARVEDLALTLFDYQLRNDGVIEIDLDRQVVEVGQLKLRGEGTQLAVAGNMNLTDRSIDVSATGDANLGILQGFFRDLRASGVATLAAGASGTFDKPQLSGKATINNGRVRHFLMPRSLDQINGTVSFDAAGLRLDTVTATLGGGTVTFGGRIPLEGFMPGELSLTAVGEGMRINYPEGFRSEIDADLTLRGTVQSPLLTGTVAVRDAVYERRFETTPNLFEFGGRTLAVGGPAVAPAVPLRFDIQINAPPGSLRIQNNVARLEAGADLRLQGTYDRPQLSGRAEIRRGDLVFEGNRYIVTRGTIDFVNPATIDPYFDLEAETRVRFGPQTYRVTLAFLGTKERFVPTITSDPPLPMADIVALLLGQDPAGNLNELRSLSAAGANTETDVLAAFTARLLTSPFSAPVGEVAERVFGSGTTELITPSIGTEEDPLAPTARLVIGRRLSSRAYLTFSRGLGNSTHQQIIVLEYDQNERVGWIITQNGDRTFAIDFRVRHVF
jgi:autotransporter translocation and assembly factor TamB